jgi:hypothetical protein
MAHTLTEALLHTASVTVPDDGDDLDAASVEVGFQALADRTNLAHAQLTGAMPCTGSALLCQAGIVADGNIISHDNVIIDGFLLCNSTTTFSQPVICNNVLTLNSYLTANAQISAPIANLDAINAVDIAVSNELVGKVRRKLRYQHFTDDANKSITVASYDHISVGNTLTASRTWDLTTTGLTSGDSCEFSNRSNWNVLLKVGGSTVFTLTTGTYDQKVRLVWDGAAFFAG